MVDGQCFSASSTKPLISKQNTPVLTTSLGTFSASRGQHLQANHNAEFLPPCLTKRLPPPVCGSSGGTLSPPCWLFLGAKWALGHFLPTSYCNHSSVPNKTLFCLMPGPLLWRTGLSPTSLNRDFPGSIVVRTPCFHCRGCRFDPPLENQEPTCHEVWSKKKKNG